MCFEGECADEFVGGVARAAARGEGLDDAGQAARAHVVEVAQQDARLQVRGALAHEPEEPHVVVVVERVEHFDGEGDWLGLLDVVGQLLDLKVNI